MASVQTYQGIVRGGNIQVEGTADLPEGSHVVIIVPGEHPPMEERAAQRKATRWLVEHVGNMLLADEGRLVDVDAAHGNMLTDEQQAEELIHHGTAFTRSLSSPER